MQWSPLRRYLLHGNERLETGKEKDWKEAEGEKLETGESRKEKVLKQEEGDS